ncbi:Ankyrin repeat domain-containing protein, partial [Tetrabaena socialis]
MHMGSDLANKRQRALYRLARSPTPPLLPRLPHCAAGPTTSDPASVWLPELVQRFAASLDPNEVACVLRLVNKATAALFREAPHVTIRLSQPVPHREFVRRWGGEDALHSLARARREDLLCLTARSGVIPNLEALLTRSDFHHDTGALSAAAAAGQLDVCIWLHGRGCRWLRDVLVVAAKAGQQPKMATWVSWTGCVTPAAPMRAAPTSWEERRGCTNRGGLGVELSHLMQEFVISSAACSPTTDWQAKVDAAYIASIIAAKGYLEALQYVLAHGAEWREVDPMKTAAEGGHLALMELLRARGHRIRMEVVEAAAVKGQLPAVAWLVEALGAQTALSAEVFASAAESGSMELMAWLRARGCPWDQTAILGAVSHCSEEQLEWLVEQGCPMGVDGEPYVRAAADGDMAMLRCLRRLGCPWSTGTFQRLVGRECSCSWERGRRAFSWLRDEGCPVDLVAAIAEARQSVADRLWHRSTDTCVQLERWLCEQ